MNEYERKVLDPYEPSDPQLTRNGLVFWVVQALGTLVFCVILWGSNAWIQPTDLMILWLCMAVFGAIKETWQGDMHHISLLVVGGGFAVAMFYAHWSLGIGAIVVAAGWAQDRLSLTGVMLGHLAQLVLLLKIYSSMGGGNAVG